MEGANTSTAEIDYQITWAPTCELQDVRVLICKDILTLFVAPGLIQVKHKV